jgi:hypothetical protein
LVRPTFQCRRHFVQPTCQCRRHSTSIYPPNNIWLLRRLLRFNPITTTPSLRKMKCLINIKTTV